MQQQNGNVVWFEVMGQDLEGLHRFYSELFGWKLKNDDGAPYLLSDAAQTGIGGGVGKAPAGPGWSAFYVQVDDVQAAVDRAVRLGGKVLNPPTSVGCTTIAMVADPEGHPVGFARTND
ncbi:MAG: VOC family protein [Myxococcales bacterium]|nr:VOC family protein [Myxococcales bacterium]MCB9540337.1 VOC family protein [Myxococcales bacterium]